jgi:hypothetical protein
MVTSRFNGSDHVLRHPSGTISSAELPTIVALLELSSALGMDDGWDVRVRPAPLQVAQTCHLQKVENRGPNLFYAISQDRIHSRCTCAAKII